MDVTPQELRSSEIKDSWRGYDRDEVDDLLERAAITIESLTQQVQEVQSRPVPTVAAAAAPPADVPLPSSRDDAEMLQRTLLLAQRAADDAVNEAQARAKQLLDESEAKAQTLVSDAEATARRIAEGERRRLEAELLDLSARREQLRADADALEEYVALRFHTHGVGGVLCFHLLHRAWNRDAAARADHASSGRHAAARRRTRRRRQSNRK